MNCPNCNVALVQTKRDGIEMEICPKCSGMWLTSQELAELEDEVFDFGDDEKGSLMFAKRRPRANAPNATSLCRPFNTGSTISRWTFVLTDMATGWTQTRTSAFLK